MSGGAGQHARLERATEGLDAPFACVDLDAFDANRADMARRAGGTPIRVASKSIRCRALVARALADPAYRGVLALTLPEALWLAEHGYDDVVVAYPTVDRGALRRLVALAAPTADPPTRLAVMVDAVEHLDRLLEAGAGPERPVDVCLELDAGLWLGGGRVRLGAKRSPLHEPAQLAALAAEVVARPGLRVAGVMGYEAQIAGVGDRPGNPLMGRAIGAMQRVSRIELARRRARAIAAVERVTGPLGFVNAGGTGSLESSAGEAAVTEVAAGSGLLAPALFDTYSRFTPTPAAFFALPIVRRPGAGVATALGGGYVASGAVGPDRLPRPTYPEGLRLDGQEGAGEAQTPLLGEAADRLAIGDRVWFRHTKAGELCERFTRLYLVAGDEIVDEVPTYRGEGYAFL
ncbi:alanine racemase [Patulibacter defluvii]|uniref:alanine racemase n=1 Tax=Patulibacter defluvii TaxID=3095358 RepID=UPI002A754F33|nr:alanine racemase [Patulibacter sp. DM4]